MTPSKNLFYLCGFFIAGIFLESVIYNFFPDYIKNQALYIALGFLLAGITGITVSVLLKKHNYTVAGFWVLFLVLGILRYQISEFNIQHHAFKNLNDSPDKITLIGQISDEPDARDSFQKLKVAVGENTILVTADRYPEYAYLDTIQITGKLKTPAVFEDFNYKNYLLKDRIYSVMDYASIELIPNRHNYNAFSFLYEKVLLLKRKLVNSVNLNFSSPYSFIVQGIVYGNDKNMPQDLKDKFNATGLSHITAVSGGNVVILISMLMPLLLALGFWRSHAFYIAFIFVWFYIVLVGFPASAIRAGIMGSLAVFASALGRQNTGSRAIVMAGAIMLLQNPLLLLYDIGFQLSFLASLGIIHAKPIIDYFLVVTLSFAKRIKSDALETITEEKPHFLLTIISVTISAQLFALPIILYNFGNISLVSVITNLLILPVVPFIMVLGFLTSIFGIFSHFLGWFFSIPCWILLAYVVKILHIFSRPWAVLTVKNVSWVWFVIYYVILSFIILRLQKSIRGKHFSN